MRKIIRIGDLYFNIAKFELITFEGREAHLWIRGHCRILEEKDAEVLRSFLDRAYVSTNLTPLLNAGRNAE